MSQRIDCCVLKLHELWASGASYREIAAALGCGESFVHKLKIRHKLPNRQKPTIEIFADDPTPDQIAVESAKLREKHLQWMRESKPKESSVPPGIRQYALGRYGFAVVS